MSWQIIALAGLSGIIISAIAFLAIRHLMRRQDQQLREWFREARRNELN